MKTSETRESLSEVTYKQSPNPLRGADVGGGFRQPDVGGFGQPDVGGFGQPDVGGFRQHDVGGFGQSNVGDFKFLLIDEDWV